MRRSVLVVSLASVGLLVPALAGAGKLPPPSKLTLVQAQCPGPPAGPCSTFTFAKGVAVLKSQREPKPTCPKTGMPDETNGGSVTLRGVTKSGTSFDGSLTAEVVLFTTFGTDPNGNCELEGTQITTPSLVATLDCKHGKCKGTLVPIACLPASCADTPITSELRSLVVRDDAAQSLATVGTTLAPEASGGS
jgi:hypothetical protein